MLDGEFVKELKKLNGDGSRDARFRTMEKALNAQRELSTPKVRDSFNGVLKKYGRAIVGICVASTIVHRDESLYGKERKWALEVLDIWKNRGSMATDRLYICDNLHPTRILEYAGDLIRYTTEGDTYDTN